MFVLDFVLRTRYINSIVNEKKESECQIYVQYFNTSH